MEENIARSWSTRWTPIATGRLSLAAAISNLASSARNFTVEGLSDDTVCIGDRYRIGGAVFEVTQPRVTCYRVGIRMAEPAMAALLVSHHRPGFDLRVLEEGEVGAGDEITRIADGPEHLTVAAIDALLYLPDRSRDQLEHALRIPALSSGWKSSLRALVDQDSSTKGNPGLTNSGGAPPAWSGFRPLRVTKVERESSDVISLSFESPDGLHPRTAGVRLWQDLHENWHFCLPKR